MRWKLPQQYEHIGRPSLSLRRRTRLSHRGHRKKLQEPPFGKRRCASRTSRLSSIAPKPIQTLVMSAVILPSALSRETLGETGRHSSNNLCVMTLTISRRRREGEQRDETEAHHFSSPAAASCHRSLASQNASGPTALAISVAPIPSLRSDTMRARSKVARRPWKPPSPLRRRCRQLPIADEAKLHLGDHAEHSQDHAARPAAGINGRLQHSEACSFFLQFVDKIEDVPRVSA